MRSQLVVERFLGANFVDEPDESAFEDFCVELNQLYDVELESEPYTNLIRHTIRKHAAMLSFLIDANTTVVYPSFYRPRWEVKSGYKEAVRRGANLYETEVFNMLFQFHGGRFRGDGIALMCHGPNGFQDEWILLCPDDTEMRIQAESNKYREIALAMTFRAQMNSDLQSELLENLSALLPAKRCANSLMHEYGHVLQYRLWESEGIQVRDFAALYRWFLERGYAQNVSARIPKFADYPDETKLRFLKEAFVEDYRIGLNVEKNGGIFELPNAYCFRGDFEDPSLMAEGVEIVKQAVKKKTSSFRGSYGQANEPDRVLLTDQIMANSSDFSTRNPRMTTEDHQAVLDRLHAKSKLQPV
ncbi:hypothetical protein CBW65_10775 [Tumebacillus avium]|uniref:Uncharacterized protein n=1 Tax=Tumebacillus avium TaxID=1903704 RepID=A0A1Y0IQ16_9BACL|nr:hypothetical protein [Tumebacillus avium]ARU61434.1 hypothetical protein CBW65_10775 [Tumebacillus avium]